MFSRPLLAASFTALSLPFLSTAPAHAATQVRPAPVSIQRQPPVTHPAGVSDRFGLIAPDGAVVDPNAIPGVVLPLDFQSYWALDNNGSYVQPRQAVAGDDVNVIPAWRGGALGQGITVADVDSGLDTTGLNVQIAPGGFDFTENAPLSPDSDLLGHGTWTASLISATGGGNAQFIGVAPNSQLLPLRVLITGSGTDAGIAAAFNYAAAHGARVVNASLAGSGTGDITQFPSYKAMQQNPNTLFVVSAGNAGLNNDGSGVTPCVADQTLPNVICVGAVDVDFTRASFSDYGASSVDLMAPGVEVFGDWPKDGQAQPSWGDGTSASAPLVSGAAADVLSANPALTATQLKSVLLSTARRVPALDGLCVTGGVVDVGAAVDAARSLPGGSAPSPSKRPASTAAVPRLSRAVIRTRGSARTLSFQASAPARVRVRVRALECSPRGCRWHSLSPHVVSAHAGANTVGLGVIRAKSIRFQLQVLAPAIR